jgi:hypothetical protein
LIENCLKMNLRSITMLFSPQVYSTIEPEQKRP